MQTEHVPDIHLGHLIWLYLFRYRLGFVGIATYAKTSYHLAKEIDKVFCFETSAQHARFIKLSTLRHLNFVLLLLCVILLKYTYSI